MRDRKIREILSKLLIKSNELSTAGHTERAAGVNAAVIIIGYEVENLEKRKQERFSKKLIREENTEKYRRDLYG